MLILEFPGIAGVWLLDEVSGWTLSLKPILSVPAQMISELLGALGERSPQPETSWANADTGKILPWNRDLLPPFAFAAKSAGWERCR